MLRWRDSFHTVFLRQMPVHRGRPWNEKALESMGGAATVPAATAFFLWDDTICGRWLDVNDTVAGCSGQQGEPRGFGAAVVEHIEDKLLVERAFEINQLQLQLPLPGTLQPGAEDCVAFGLQLVGGLQIVSGCRPEQFSGEPQFFVRQSRIAAGQMQHSAAFMTAFGGNNDGIAALGKLREVWQTEACHLRNATVSHQRENIHRQVTGVREHG